MSTTLAPSNIFTDSILPDLVARQDAMAFFHHSLSLWHLLRPQLAISEPRGAFYVMQCAKEFVLFRPEFQGLHLHRAATLPIPHPPLTRLNAMASFPHYLAPKHQVS